MGYSNIWKNFPILKQKGMAQSGRHNFWHPYRVFLKPKGVLHCLLEHLNFTGTKASALVENLIGCNQIRNPRFQVLELVSKLKPEALMGEMGWSCYKRSLKRVIMGSRKGGHMSMWNDRIGLLFCSMFPVQVGITPFILSCLVPLGQFKNVNMGSIISIMSLAYGCYDEMLQLISPFFSSFSPWIPYFCSMWII